MESCSEEGRLYGPSVVNRPTFLPLSLKRNGYCPSLSDTPEHGPLYDAIVGMRQHGVSEWDLLSPPRYDVSKSECDDISSEVFSMTREEKCGSAVIEPPNSENGKRTKRGIYMHWGSRDDVDGGSSCCQWLRSYICKLWIKTPPDPPPPKESTPKPKLLTILERESTFKQISPKQLRRFSKKQQSITNQFVYSAFIEDTTVELHEERHKDVVYSITIKKDGSLTKDGSCIASFSDDNMKEKNTTRHLKGATLDFLVARLAEIFLGESDDVNFLNVFFTTYRSFTSPEELFKKLKHEYMKHKDESSTKNIAVLKSIVLVFRAWLERHLLDDFQDGGDHKLLRDMQDLAQVHDDFINKNDQIFIEKKSNDRSLSPSRQRRNGVVSSASFADYVSAKFATLAKSAKDNEARSPEHSPSHSQNPSLDLSSPEGTTLNSAVSKTLLNSLSSRHVATQLTVIAAKLFHCVQPHHCLAAVASSKHRPRTVRATIDQFNKVVYCVVGTILCPSLKVSQRSKLLTKWIEVAQECRELKNFSTLRAIVSGLQTHSLHRLKKAWMYVPLSRTNLLREMADMNMKDLLMKVGTAKVNTEDSAIHRVRKEASMRRVQDMHSGIIHGTVPYLGSFLTDLTYLDTAKPNYLEGGLINFDKHRKEFELLAQLQLWQASCRSYQNLEPDEDFMKWFRSVAVLTEDQSLKLSEMIEQPILSVASPSLAVSPTRKSIMDMIHAEADKNMSSSPLWQRSLKKAENGSCAGEGKGSHSFSGRINTSFASSSSDKNRIVKIRLVRSKTKAPDGDVLDLKTEEVSGGDSPVATCEYKMISISSDERRAAVVKRALGSFMLNVEEHLKRFSLVQLLQDKEIQIPHTANVFYAMNWSDHEPTLVLLEEGAEIPCKVKRHQSTPNQPKKSRHRKNNSVTLEVETGRASSLSNVTSPVKSLYKQLAFNSLALVSSPSYSLSNANRRSSDGGERITKGESVVLVNSKSGADLDNGDDVLEKNVSPGDTVGMQLAGFRRSSRCRSVDFTGEVLPVRPSLTSPETPQDSRLPKSAPSSPQVDKRGAHDDKEFRINRSSDVIHAAAHFTKWPRHSMSEAGRNIASRSQTWSGRRTIRKPKKKWPASTFYINNNILLSPAEEENVTPTRSEFYVELDKALPKTQNVPRQATIGTRSFSSRTLPSGFAPGFSGHDYDADDGDNPSQSSRASLSLDDPVQRSSSFATMSSNQSPEEVIANIDSGTGITFLTPTSEDEVFQGSNESHTESKNQATDSKSGNSPVSVEESPKGPIIKIQGASPRKKINESDFFERYSETISLGEEFENKEDLSTVL